MGIIKLALISLKKDMSKSIFYFLTFFLTTIFIFSFFNLTFNPYAGINLGKDDTTLVTPIAVFVIVIAMLCVFLANNFYVSHKGKEISIILMSGASIYQLGFYLFIQVFIIMLTAIPLGLAVGYLLIPTINSIFLITFNYHGEGFYLANQTLVATLSIVGFEVLWCSMLNLGYCVRSTITSMLHEENKIDLSGLKAPQFSKKLFIILYLLPVIIFWFIKDSTSYMFIALFGVVGVFGIVKQVLPDWLRKRQSNESLENPVDLIALGFFHSDLQKVFALVIISLMASIILTCLTVYALNQPLVSMVSLMSYLSVMILMSLTIVFKVGMELFKRKANYENLARLGFSLEQLKLIIKKEMTYFYGVILLLPLFYQVIMLINLLFRNQITIYLFIIILVIQIVPILISYLLSLRLYQTILPESMIQER